MTSSVASTASCLPIDAIKYLIVGYTRLSRIPYELNNIIFLYYNAPRDTWDSECISSRLEIIGNTGECDLEIDENGPKIIVKRVGFNSAYLTNIVHSGKHTWKFRIEPAGGWWFFIGIWKVGRGKMLTDRWFNSETKDNSYSFAANSGCIMDPKDPNSNSWNGRHTTSTKYGVECKKDDVIEMHLDFYERTLAYSINGKYFGIAYSNIEETEYRGVVGLFYQEDAVRLISYIHEIDLNLK